MITVSLLELLLFLRLALEKGDIEKAKQTLDEAIAWREKSQQGDSP